MVASFNSFPKTAKVFVYPSSRKFYTNELEELHALISGFISNWKNEENPTKAGYEILYNRFIIIVVDDNEKLLTTNSIDTLVQFIIELQETYNVILLDKMNVCFKQGAFVQYKDLKDFKKLVKSKAVSAKTIVFDNLIQTKADLEEAWEVPISESWYARFL